ncbi:hypothetical protein KA005_21050 [bacterium]|nr:hypothetical protein [bacterium]
MINLFDWFWVYRKRYYGGFVIGFYKIFSIWFTKGGIEITIAEPSYKRMSLWWIKIYFLWDPVRFSYEKKW